MPEYHLPMTNKEIAAHYRQAKNPQQDIRVIADLCAADVNTIKDILREEGELKDMATQNANAAPTAGQPAKNTRLEESDAEAQQIRDLFEQGMSDEEIAGRLSGPVSRVVRIRKEYGLLRRRKGAAKEDKAHAVSEQPFAEPSETAMRETEKPALPQEYGQIEAVLSAIPEDADECILLAAQDLVTKMFLQYLQRRFRITKQPIGINEADG